MTQPDEPKPGDLAAMQRGINDMLARDRMTMDYKIVFDVPPDAETQPAEPDQPR